MTLNQVKSIILVLLVVLTIAVMVFSPSVFAKPAGAIQAPAAFDSGTSQITTTTTAITAAAFGFTSDEVNSADRAILTARGTNLNFATGAADDPTTTTGRVLVANDEVVIEGSADIAGLRFIQATGTVTVTVTLLKMPGS